MATPHAVVPSLYHVRPPGIERLGVKAAFEPIEWSKQPTKAKPMTPQEFIAKWKRSKLSERSGSHEHFLDLCALLNEPTPAQTDPDGTEYTFERGVSKTGGGKGWADVWKRHYFAWEYKGKHKDLVEAYNQLLRYREALENPPLNVVCDMNRFEVHTNFTNTVTKVYEFNLDSLAEPGNLYVLRKLFTDPAALEPKQTPNDITEEVAKQFAQLADGMRKRHIPSERAAHFLMKLMFCMFAQGIGLLEGKLFSKILASVKISPTKLSQKLRGFFQAMTTGGEYKKLVHRHDRRGHITTVNCKQGTDVRRKRSLDDNRDDCLDTKWRRQQASG
jgi:hypothetical protein